jgi:hypothetical protein
MCFSENKSTTPEWLDVRNEAEDSRGCDYRLSSDGLLNPIYVGEIKLIPVIFRNIKSATVWLPSFHA